MISPADHIKLSIPNPCRENWDKMTPVEKGRFCQQCNKTVIDFSQLSDEEVVRIISRQKEEICGRLLQSQLSRPIILPKKTSLYRKYISGKMVAATALQDYIRDHTRYPAY